MLSVEAVKRDIINGMPFTLPFNHVVLGLTMNSVLRTENGCKPAIRSAVKNFGDMFKIPGYAGSMT